MAPLRSDASLTALHFSAGALRAGELEAFGGDALARGVEGIADVAPSAAHHSELLAASFVAAVKTTALRGALLDCARAEEVVGLLRDGDLDGARESLGRHVQQFAALELRRQRAIVAEFANERLEFRTGGRKPLLSPRAP